MKMKHRLLLGAIAASLALPVAAQVIDVYPIPQTDGFPFGITVGSDRNLWFSEAQFGHVGRITTAGVITEFPTGAVSLGDITGGPDGNLWFVYQSGVGRITTSGTTTLFPTAGPTGSGLITSGPDGNLWFTENGANKIGRVTPAGVVTEFTLPHTDSQPLGIVAGQDGNLWFTEYQYAKIGRITPAGVITEFPIPDYGWQIASGMDGHLWYTTAAYKPSCISSIDTTGTWIGKFGFPMKRTPEGLWSAADGRLWFTVPVGNTIGSMTLQGAFQLKTLPVANGGPREIVEGPDGDIWFTMQNGNAIGRLEVASWTAEESTKE
jgi:streptogramin lyase